MYDKFKDYPLMNDRKGSVPLFYPHIPKSAIKSLKKFYLVGGLAKDH